MKIISNVILPILIVVISMYTSGCSKERIVGNGNVIIENRTAPDFSRIISRGDFLVTVVPDSVTSIKVEAESNIIPYINTIVSGNTIIVDFDNDATIHEHSPIRITLHTLHCEYLELQGSGAINSGNFNEEAAELFLSGSGNIESSFNADKLTVSISCSGSVAINGSANETTMRVSGSGNIRALNFRQDICNASISGSGDIYVNVTQKLIATISGSGSVYYTGNPLVETHISGSGKAEKY